MGSDKEFYKSIKKSNECACGKSKREGFAFCFGCYNYLPSNLQSYLYQEIGEGFEEAYEEAFEYLVSYGKIRD